MHIVGGEMTEEYQDSHIEETEKLVTISKAIENAAQLIHCYIIVSGMYARK